MQSKTIDGVPSEPCQWTDLQILDFLSVALRNVDLVGTVKLSEIRQGFEYMRNKLPAAQPQGEPVAYLDLEKIKPAGMAYATAVRVNHRQEALYIRPDPSEQRARALLAEVIKGEPEAYKNAFYPDRHGPDMAEWVERPRLSGHDVYDAMLKVPGVMGMGMGDCRAVAQILNRKLGLL